MHFSILIAAGLLAIVQPRKDTHRVHDYANLLAPAQRESLEAVARDVEQKTTAQLAIVTVNSLDGKTVEAYATELFNTWGIGQRNTNNGVLLLVAPRERRMRIEVGFGLEPLLTDALCGEIADVHIISRFKEDDYAGGIVAGTRELARVLLDNQAAARGDPNSGPMLARRARRRALFATSGVALAAAGLLALAFLVASRRIYSTTTFMAVTSVVAALIAIAAYLLWRTPRAQQPIVWFSGASAASLATWAFNLVRYRRYGPRGCSKCGTPLELLSEQDDDEQLSAVQRLEEQLDSVDYDVWICPACLHNDTERYVKPFSGLKECVKCKGRAFKEDPQKVIRAATRLSSGLAEVEGRCVACNYKAIRQVILPKISDSSSSGGGGWSGGGGGGGGGSFGGGSSGGGGASRGW